MVYWEILEANFKLFSMPEFEDKNDIWVFREGQMNLLYTDLYKLKDSVKKLYPKNSNGFKTAIVGETGFQRSLAKLYSDIGEDLPRGIRVISNLQSSEDWITK